MKYLISFFGFILLFSSCENSEDNFVNFIEFETLSVEELTNSEILYTENGSLKVKVISQKMERFSGEEERIELSGNVHFDFYKLDSDSSKSVLTCNKAVINNTTDIMTASQSVVLKSSEGKELITEELIWDKEKNIIYTDLEITIKTKDELIKGVGFQSNPDFEEYKIKKASGIFSIEN